MKAGIVAFLANLLLDYSLPLENLDFRTWGTRSSDSNRDRTNRRSGGCYGVGAQSYGRKPFIRGACTAVLPCADGFSSEVIVRKLPLLLNETLWAGGNGNAGTLLFSRGLVVVAGINIATTLSNMFSIVYIAMEVRSNHSRQL